MQYLELHSKPDATGASRSSFTSRRCCANLAIETCFRQLYDPTGAYHGAFELACAAPLPLCKANPLHARRFARARGTRAKTDAVDARMLALMGAAFELEPDQLIGADRHDLKELQVEGMALLKDRTGLLNRLKTRTRRRTKARPARAERRLVTIDAEVQARLTPDRGREIDILRAIPGIGSVAAAIPIGCPKIGTLGRKKIAGLAGLAPTVRQSGRWQGRAFIQGGRKFPRDALYRPALVAIRFNPDMKAKALRLNLGSPAAFDRSRATGRPHSHVQTGGANT